MANPKYRLAYYDVRGLAEPIRWIFRYTDTPFVDERIPWDYPKWFSEIKKQYASTVGQIPVLYEEGKPELCQSHVISRYLAKKFGLTGDNDWEDARIDEIISLTFDLFISWRTLAMFARTPEQKAINKVRLDAMFPLYYQKFNETLEKSGGDFVLGKKLTHADFWLAHIISIFDDPVEGDGPIMPEGYNKPCQEDVYLDMTKKFPALRAHKERIHAIPQIRDWIKIRHKTMGLRYS